MSPLPTIVNNYNLSSMFHKTMSMTQKKRIAYGYSNRSEEPSRRTLSRQAAQKCMGKGMSRYRDFPRATLCKRLRDAVAGAYRKQGHTPCSSFVQRSTDTNLQSLRKDILRQHFGEFHHSHPEPILFLSLQLAGTHVCIRSHYTT